jgi:hypothetical protein
VTTPDFRAWLESGSFDLPHDWEITDNSVRITLGPGSPPLTLSSRHIASLRQRRLPRIRGLTQVRHCGLEIGTYGEYLIYVEGWRGWPVGEHLRFKVGNASVQAGPISLGSALLLESLYKSDDFVQEEFSRYASLQVTGARSPRAHALQALFHLNSDYLRPFKLSASVLHLLDPNEPYPFPDVDSYGALVRKRVRTRPRLDAAEAMCLFVHAAAESGDARFLGFYRVLEFFFARGALAEFGRLRRDSRISDADLLLQSRLEKELPQLKALVRSTLTAAETRKLTAFVRHHKLAAVNGIDDVATALYAYRNGLVHAKESEIERTSIPSPFEAASERGPWAWVAELVADRAIRRLSALSSRGDR